MIEATDQFFLRLGLRLGVAALIITALSVGRELLIPMALALFFCFLLSPLAGWLERRARLGRAVSALLVVTASLAAVGGFGWFVGRQGAALVRDLPQHQHAVVAKFRGVNDTVSTMFARASEVMHRITRRPTDSAPTARASQADAAPESAAVAGDAGLADRPSRAADEPVKVELVPSQRNAFSVIGLVLGPVVHPLATLGATTVLLLFFLVNRADLRDRLVRIVGSVHVPATTAAFDDCGRRIMRFLIAQATANCIIGVATGLGLYLLGVPSAALWGVLAAVARLVPYLGAFVAAMFPFVMSIALFEGWQVPLMVLGWCVLVDVLSANLLEPLLYGSRTGVSPTAILAAFMFWTWLWGGIGLFLATPITVCLVVIGKHIPAFNSLYILLSDEQVFEPAARLYQRLLARDGAEAERIVREHVEQIGALDACDRVILPGLAQVEADRHADVIDPDRLAYVLETARGIMAKLALEPTEAAGGPVARPGGEVLVVTNGGLFDELAAAALLKAAESVGVSARLLSPDLLAAEVAEEIDAARPLGLVLTGIEPRALGRLRLVYKKSDLYGPSLPVQVAIFCVSPSSRRSAGRLARECGARDNARLAEAFTRFTAGVRPVSAAPPTGLRLVTNGV